MSGSWDQLGREFIDELKETLRLQFSQIQVEPVETTFEASSVTYLVQIETETYGGRLLQAPDVTVYQPTFQLAASTASLKTWPLVCLEAIPLVFDHPGLLQMVPALYLGDEQLVTVPLIPRESPVCDYELGPFDVSLYCYNEEELTFKNRSSGCRTLQVEGFARPPVQRVQPMSTVSKKYPLHVKAFPFRRQPLLPHRFSPEKRKYFREQLAQRSNHTYQDIQLVRVYDRVFLELFKSLSQDPGGLLLCYPKSQDELNRLRKTPRPYYVIIGKSIKEKSNKMIQTAVLMDETS